MKTGFTLIELLIVVLIVGVLSSIAIPAYCDYIPRQKVAESIAMAQNITARISTYARTNKQLPDNINSEFFKLPDNNKYIESLTWYAEQSTLLMALNPKVVGKNRYLVFTATGAIDNLQWQCSNKHTLISNKPILDRNLPHNCRSNTQ